MNVSGQFVTGIPRAVAAAISMLSTPTLPKTIARHVSGRASTTLRLNFIPLA